jgi:CheY-like chemotaxis protein
MKARILVVDDEEIVIRSCLRILGEDADKEVEAVQDGLEALRKIDENHYDVLILDIMMPKMDGLEVLRRVK